MKPRILVPYDFSPAAERALAWAADLHRAVGGAIKLLHVLPIVPGATAMLPTPPPLPTEEDLLQVERSLRDAAAPLVADATVEAVLAANAAAGVMDAIRAWSPDLVVMGTHGRGGVKRLVLGSVAEHIVRTADCPVVTMRAAPHPKQVER